jgi:hypothetical protein
LKKKRKCHVHITTAITNVNSLFTLGIFIGLFFNPNDPFNTLNTNPSCIPTTDIAENLVVAVQYSLRVGMLVSGIGSVLGCGFLVLALVKLCRLSLGL